MVLQPIPLRTSLFFLTAHELLFLGCILGVAAPNQLYSAENLVGLITSQCFTGKKPEPAATVSP